MIKKLEEVAANDCAAWFELSYDDQEKFSKEYAAYVDTNPSETESYLSKQEVTFTGILSIAFEAISCFSDHPEIVMPAVKKVLDHSYGKEEFDLWNLEVIDNIDTLELFERNKSVYMEYMDLLASCLRSGIPNQATGYFRPGIRTSGKSFRKSICAEKVVRQHR